MRSDPFCWNVLSCISWENGLTSCATVGCARPETLCSVRMGELILRTIKAYSEMACSQIGFDLLGDLAPDLGGVSLIVEVDAFDSLEIVWSLHLVSLFECKVMLSQLFLHVCVQCSACPRLLGKLLFRF